MKRFSLLKDEKKIKTIIPIKIYTKCLKKKKQLFVSNLSEAIKDVDTKEKNKPKLKKNVINIKSVLSIFFHHS